VNSYVCLWLKLLVTLLLIPQARIAANVVMAGTIPVVVDGQTVGETRAVPEDAVGMAGAPLGEPGNTILFGHSDKGGQVFRNLPQVTIGTYIYIQSDSGELVRYRVEETYVVLEKGVSLEQRVQNARFLAPTSDERLTLITCVGNNAEYRLIVIARPASTNTRLS